MGFVAGRIDSGAKTFDGGALGSPFKVVPHVGFTDVDKFRIFEKFFSNSVHGDGVVGRNDNSSRQDEAQL